MTKPGSAGGDGAVGKRRARFNRWRSDRPFAGGALLILASLIIAWIPINIAPDTILLGKALSPVGLLFAALVFMCGMFALTRPGLADIFGLFGILFSVFSLYGALGGLGLGLVVGLVGGNLCYAWEEEETEEEAGGGSGGDDTVTNATGSDESGFDFDDDSGDDSGGLFGTRSVRSSVGSSGSSPASRTGAGGRTASVALLVVAVVVLSVFAQPFVAAAAGNYPAQQSIDGTIVIAEEFSGQSYNHQRVFTDTSNKNSVSAARQSFSSATITGMTIYKNFHGPGGASHLTINGTKSTAPNGLSLTSSEFYASQLELAGAVPLARNKWSTCPGQDFLLRYGDVIRPPITGEDVTTNTHQLTANTVTIQNLELTVQEGTKNTSVTGTPECTKNPVEPVLDLLTANVLNLLADDGVLNSSVINGTGLTGLSAPGEVNLTEPFDASATVTNTGVLNDTKTVEYRLDNRTIREQTVSLGPNENTTVTFEGIRAGNMSEGTYEQGVFTGNGSVTRDLSVVNETDESNPAANDTVNATNGSGGAVGLSSTDRNGLSPARSSGSENATNGTETGANETDGNETAAANETTTETPTTTSTTETPTTTSTDESTPETTNSGDTARTTTATTQDAPETTTPATDADSSETTTETTPATQTTSRTPTPASASSASETTTGTESTTTDTETTVSTTDTETTETQTTTAGNATTTSTPNEMAVVGIP